MHYTETDSQLTVVIWNKIEHVLACYEIIYRKELLKYLRKSIFGEISCTTYVFTIIFRETKFLLHHFQAVSY